MVNVEVIDGGSIARARTRLVLMGSAFEVAPRAMAQGAGVIYRDKLREHAPKRTGDLARSHRFETFPMGTGWGVRFRALKRSIFIIQGTGIYGPKGVVITPTTKQALYWDGAAHPVAYVRGIRPNDYRKRAVAAADPEVRVLMHEAGIRVARAGRL